MVCRKVGMSVEQRVGREAAWMDDRSVESMGPTMVFSTVAMKDASTAVRLVGASVAVKVSRLAEQ